MTFDDILEQVITLLKRQGRVSYPALKIRFSLDDQYLEALKAEIIEAQQLATDENGRVLVWTGNTAEISVAASPSAQPTPPPAVQEQPSPEITPRVPASPDAERRQLTVMFCDLVDSTTLSSRLDPEDYRDVVRAYQATCTEVIRRYDGHIAQLLGDGLLVYFGYPHAHEDDAQRAVRTGLGILDAMGDLHKRLEQEKGITLALRLGIHTGLVVIGAMGGGRQEQLALGETPNIAARIQGLAEPNTLVISEATSRLIQGYFEYQALGEHALRGVSEPVRLYQILQESGATSRLDVAQPRGLTPLVGRESEVALLLERWAQVKAGHGHVVLLSGEAGIGKSRLVQVLKDHVANELHVRWECRSSEYYQNTALFPITDLFQRLLRLQAEDTPNEKLEKLEQALSQYRLPVVETVPLLAPVLSLSLPEHRYPLLNLSPQRQRQKTLETIVAILLELAEHQPVLFILEDLHWTDPTTLEFLGLLVEQVPTTAIATLLTCRPHFQPSWHHRSYITEITLNHLSHPQVEQIVNRMTDGKILPQEVLVQIVEKTDGVPLFVEELTKAILEAGYLQETPTHYELTGTLPALAIPATLQDSLMARLDRLISAKGIAQLGAVMGRQFSHELLEAVSQLDTATLQQELGRLVEAELLYQRGLPPRSTYTFKHALVNDIAYQSLLKSTRQQYHRQIAEVLEERFPEMVATQPELLAHHYTEAGLIEQAVGYWHRAGEQAIEHSANVEAMSHLHKGLALLKTLPDTSEHRHQELVLLTALGPALMVTKGLADREVGHTYSRARALCQQVGETPQLFPALFGLWHFYEVGAEYRLARELGEQLLQLAQRLQDPGLLLQAHHALWTTLFFLGEFVSAHEHLEQAMVLYDPQQHRSHAFLYGGHDPGVCCRSIASMILWQLGYPDQARQRSHDALTLARQIAHPFSLDLALFFAAVFHAFRREVHAAQERAEATISLATDQGFPHWRTQGSIPRGWTLAHQGQVKEGIEQIRQGLRAHRATGAEVLRPSWLALLAEAYGIMGQPEAGLTALAEALTLAETTGERWYESEIHRLKGELLLQQNSGNQAEAGTCFQQAISIARSQQAKSFELRATTSLARLWQQQGKRQEAHALLAPVYYWFTEGFDTADLQDAKALLDELA